MRLRHLVPLAAGLATAVLGLGGIFWRPAWWILLALILVHQGAGLAFAARAVGWRRLGLTLALPPVFFLLHLAYGFGSLLGAVTRPQFAHADTLS